MGIEKLEKLLEGREEFSGFDQEEIAAAEVRLGVRLPESLKQVYARFGRTPLINGANYLIPPRYLAITSGFLPFYQNREDTYWWAYKVEKLEQQQADIYGANEKMYWVYVDEFLEDFLLKQCVLQFPQYLFHYQISSVSGRLMDVPLQGYFGPSKSSDHPTMDFSIRWYWREDMSEIACLIREEEEVSRLKVYTRNEQFFLTIINDLNIEKWELDCYKAYDKSPLLPFSALRFGERNLEEFKIYNQPDGSWLYENDDLPF